MNQPRTPAGNSEGGQFGFQDRTEPADIALPTLHAINRDRVDAARKQLEAAKTALFEASLVYLRDSTRDVHPDAAGVYGKWMYEGEDHWFRPAGYVTADGTQHKDLNIDYLDASRDEGSFFEYTDPSDDQDNDWDDDPRQTIYFEKRR